MCNTNSSQEETFDVTDEESYLRPIFITAFYLRLPAKCGCRITQPRPHPHPFISCAASLPPPRRPQDNPVPSGFSRRNRKASFESTPVNASAPSIEARQVNAGRRPKEASRQLNEVQDKRTKEAVLYRMFQAHDAAITDAIIVHDDQGHQELVTASLDTTVAYWSLHQTELHQSRLDSFRVSSYYPVLSLTMDSDRVKDGSISVYCGRAKANDILCWDHPPNAGFNPVVILSDQISWVRSLISTGRWMFSAVGETLRQWDLSWARPRHLKDVKIFKGNILCLTGGKDRIFAGLSDGSIQSWKISKTGDLIFTGSCKAHTDRVNALIWDEKGGILYSASNDGSIRSWSGVGLESIGICRNAHEGNRINCLALGIDGVLYSGGEDQGLIRRWNGKHLSKCQEPLFCHKHPIRVLKFGKMNFLVSGDSKGVISIWRV